MAILLNNDYRINKIDCRNFIVEKRKINKKTNQEYWEHVGGYYPNVDLVCKALKDSKMNNFGNNFNNNNQFNQGNFGSHIFVLDLSLIFLST